MSFSRPILGRGVWLLFLTLVFVAPLSAQDEVVAANLPSFADSLTVEQMTSMADLVVTGSCSGLQSVWSDPRNLVTIATVSVREVLKGGDVSEISVVLPGGADSNRKFPISMTYPGAPSIDRGEEVFLFLGPGDDVVGGYSVLGFAQGKFSVVTSDEGEQFVSRDLTKVNVKNGTGTVRGNRQLTPLSEFKQKVRAALP